MFGIGGCEEVWSSIFCKEATKPEEVLFCCILHCLLCLHCIQLVYLPVMFCLSVVIGCKYCLQYELDCVRWGIKLYTNSNAKGFL